MDQAAASSLEQHCGQGATPPRAQISVNFGCRCTINSSVHLARETVGSKLEISHER